MGDMLKELREKSKRRKQLLAQTVIISVFSKLKPKQLLFSRFQLGVSGVDELRQVLGTCVETPKRSKRGTNNDAQNCDENDKSECKGEAHDELVYRDSSTFLKVSTRSTFDFY